MAHIVAVFRLIRPLNCLLAGACVLAGAHLTPATSGWFPVFAAALAVTLVCAAGNIHNDLQDIAVDRAVHPERELVKRSVTKTHARKLALVAAVTGAISGWLAGATIFVVVITATALLFLYNLSLKRVPLLGNLIVALLASATFIVGGMAKSSDAILALPGSLIPASFAFLLHTMREMVKDIVDEKGDRAAGITTLPQFIGVRPVLVLTAAGGVILAIAAYLPYSNGWYGTMYWLVVCASVIPLSLGTSLVMLFRPSARNVRLLATSLKLSMVAGMIALLLV